VRTTNLADDKRAEALAHEIADALRQIAPDAPIRVSVYRDEVADTWAVRVTADRVRYELLMPAPGALYALFRRRVYTGFGVRSDETPEAVVAALLLRIGQTL
jgi:hypothetical protein